MVKGYCHAHVVELRILNRMAKLGYKSKEIQSVLGRSKAWATRHSKRLGRSQAAKKTKRVGRKQVYGFDGGGARHPSNSLINFRIPIGTLFYWVKGAPPHVGFALAYFFCESSKQFAHFSSMMRARTLGTIQRLSGHASDQAPYRVLKVAPPMGHRSATVVVYFVGTHLTWGMRVLGQWTWAVGSWAFYLWSLVLGFGLVYLRRRFVMYNMNK